MGSIDVRPVGSTPGLDLADRAAVLGHGRLPYVLSGALAVVAGVSAAFSLFYSSLLGGVAVGRGNLRGTALIVLVVGVPVLVGAMVVGPRGSARALVLWLGATAYLLYQAVMFCFATPMNNLFLIYVAHLGLGLWTLIALVRRIDINSFAVRTDAGLPVRAIAGITGAVAVLNALAWLGRIVPVVFTSDPSSVLHGSGLLTNPVWVQDLAFWIPLVVLAAVWMWRRLPWGILLTGSMLAFYVIESLSIASDQWWGARADASMPDFASMSAVPAFLVAAVLTALPLVWYLRHLDRTDRTAARLG